MSGINAGPAITNTANSVAVLTPTNTPINSNPQGADALRLLASGRGVNVNAAGDTPMPVINASRYIVTTVMVTNATSTSASNAFLGLFSAAGGSTGSPQGTTIVAAAALTTVTSATYNKVLTVAAAALNTLVLTAPVIYANVGSTTAGATATVDVFVIGYDVS
jgi:hypothetical protein